MNNLKLLLKAKNYNGYGPWLDESGNSKNATLENGVIAKNTVGNGIILNGSTNWIFPNVQIGNNWTVNIWYKNTSEFANGSSIITQINPAGSGLPLNMMIGNSDTRTIVCGFYSGAWNQSNDIQSYIVLNQWINIQVTWNGINMMMYINSKLINTTQLSGISADAGQDYRIGRRWDSAAYVTGEIGEVRIYNSAISQSQVTADYNASYDTFFKTVILLKAIDYSGSGPWLDQSGNSKNATLENGVIAKNTIGNGIVLNGSTSWTFPNVAVGNAWSVNVWYKNISNRFGPNGDTCIISQKNSGEHVNIVIGTISNQLCTGFCTLVTGWRQSESYYNYISINNWINIQSTWDGTNLCVYINGVLIATTQPSGPSGPSIDSGEAYRIGRGWSTNLAYVIGEIGEVRIYNYAIDQAKVTADYEESVPTFLWQPTSIPGLQMWLDGQDPLGNSGVASLGSTVTTWIDKSGKGNSGTGGNSGVTMTNKGIAFNGSGGYITNYTAHATQETGFIVFTANNISGYQGLIGSAGTGARSLNILNIPNLLNIMIIWVVSGTIGLTGGVTYLLSYSYNSKGSNIYTNGNSSGSDGRNPGYNSGITYIGQTAIAAETDPVYKFTGTISEVLIYNSALSQSQRQVIEGYLAWKWSIQSQLSISHSFLNRPPDYNEPLPPTEPTSLSSTSITNGFIISWTGGFGATSYTYTINGSAITPAINNGLTLKTASFTGLSLGTYLIIVTATNISGSVSSESFSVIVKGITILLKAIDYSGSGAWLDQSGNGRNATLENGIIAKNSTGNGIVLNGSTNWTFPNVSVGNAWTLNVWYKNTGTKTGNGASVLTQQYSSESPYGFTSIGYNNDLPGQFSIGFYNSGYQHGFDFSNRVELDKWLNIQGTWDGTKLKTYINGTLTDTTIISFQSVNSGLPWFIGRRRQDYAEYVVGEIGEVRIYNYAISSDQVRADYNNSSIIFSISPVIVPVDSSAVSSATSILDSLATNPTTIDFTNPANKAVITNYFDNIYNLIKNSTPIAVPIINTVINAYYASLNPTYFSPTTVINYISTRITATGVQGYTDDTVPKTTNSVSLLPLEAGGTLAQLDSSGNVQGYLYRNSSNQISSDNSTWIPLNGTFKNNAGLTVKVIGIGSPLILTFVSEESSSLFINTSRGLISFKTYIDSIDERIIKYSSIKNQIYCYDPVSNSFFITYGRYNTTS